ncbi:STAS/SEC14 domain-containing protein [bacterium]|nr:STAS/SEC14 domain-containing protein [bacterium]
MIEFNELNDGHVVEVKMSGRLAREDYRHFLPEVERLIDRHGKISVLMIMEDFHGWSPGGLAADVQFSLKHSQHIDRIAMVGDKKWERGMAIVCKPFTSARIQFFQPYQVDAARDWVTGQTKAEAA